jgi:hypothetical protein
MLNRILPRLLEAINMSEYQEITAASNIAPMSPFGLCTGRPARRPKFRHRHRCSRTTSGLNKPRNKPEIMTALLPAIIKLFTILPHIRPGKIIFENKPTKCHPFVIHTITTLVIGFVPEELLKSSRGILTYTKRCIPASERKTTRAGLRRNR